MISKILVTGSSAVAGTAVRAVSGDYPSKFVFATSKDCDLTDAKATQDYFAAVAPDAIIHLAAVSGGIGLSASHHASMLRDNTLMTFSVLEAARKLGVGKVVMALTAGAYPPDAPLPYREEYLHAGPSHGSNYGSSYAKRLIDPAIRAYRSEYGLKVVGLVPNGIFGPNDNFNYQDAPMLPALIRRFYEGRDGDAPIEIWGDGSPVREYTYSEDVARAFLWAAYHYDDDQVLNSGTTEANSIRDIALMIAEFMGVDPARIFFNTDKPSSVARRDTDNSRFVGLSGLHYTPFREGLRRTVEWFVDAYENRRDEVRLYSKTKG
ncbi:MAG: NAD-dependent epimerase/dehydratase family protein [Magnetospirillum sp.]